jgi:putative ABC transport system permease protein
MTDVKYAIRLARSRPMFTGIAIVTLAIGIGANTAVFNLAHALIHRSLPVPEPQRLVRYRMTADAPIAGLDLPATFLRDFGLSGPMFDALRARTSASDVFAWTRADGLTVVREGRRYPLRAAWTSGSTFGVLNLAAPVGRLLNERDDRGQAPEGWTAVISYAHWVEIWNRDPGVVGRTIVVEDTPVTIVGVLPETFTGVLTGDAPQMILPLELEPVVRGDASVRREPGALTFTVMGRLRPDATLATAAAELDAIAARLLDEAVPLDVRDETFAALRLDVVPGRSGWSSYRIEYERPLRQIQWFTGIVLLVISANLAGLLLARGASRLGEFGVRAALGASRGRLLRQLLVEHLALAAMAVPLGCAIAFWLARTAVAFFGQSASFATDSGLVLDVRPGGMVVTVAAVTGLASILVAATVPSLLATSRAATPGVRGRHGSPRLIGRHLMPVQVALSLLLVALAISAAASIFRLLSTSPGMRVEGVMMAVPDMRGRTERGADRVRLYERILTALASKPGIESAAIARDLPMSGGWSDAHYVQESDGVRREDRYVVQNVVGPGFFRTVGIQLRAGRDFTAADQSRGPAVCVLNQSAAALFFPGRRPIGQHIDRRESGTRPAVRCEVVGVVEDAKFWTLNQEPPRTVYRPLVQEGPGPVAFVAKGSNASLMAAAFREAFGDILPAGTIVTPLSLADQALASVVSQRGLAWIAGALGVLALLLTCVSLYGQVAWNVTRRTTEFGVRLALGGTPDRIVRLVIRDLGKPFVFGALGGLGAIALLSRFVAAFLYKTTIVDPLLLVASLTALGLACASAGYIPARRAARVEPAAALRTE